MNQIVVKNSESLLKAKEILKKNKINPRLKNVWFRELNSFLLSAREAGIDVKILNERGFDVLSNKFFVNTFIFNEDEKSYEKGTIYFDSFDEYFEFVNGEIYEDSCYFGYNFNKKDIEQFNIDVSKLNFKGFLNYDIDKVISVYKQNGYVEFNENKIIEGNKLFKERIKDWYAKLTNISSLKDLENEYKKFDKKFRFDIDDSLDYFLSLVIEKNGKSISDIVYEFILKFPTWRTREYITNFLDFSYFEKYYEYSYKRNKKKRKELREARAYLLENPIFKKVKYGGYSISKGLYFVSSPYQLPDIKLDWTTRWFINFEDLVLFLDFDLRNFNLRKIPFDLERKKFIIDETTVLPDKEIEEKILIDKYFLNDCYHVDIFKLSKDGSKEEICKKEFKYFFDFFYFLKGDLSNSNLSTSENIDVIKNISGINLTDAILPSKFLSTKELVTQKIKFDLKEFNTEKSLTIVEQNLKQESIMFPKAINYISDIHLPHRLYNARCKNIGDAFNVYSKICENLASTSNHNISFICGDITNDFNEYKNFFNLYSKYEVFKQIVVLGNHELWTFKGEKFEKIVKIYDDFFKTTDKKYVLLQNSLIYIYDFFRRDFIHEEELLKLTSEEIRDKTKNADIVIFGGIGFAGQNEILNANNGIYNGVISREEEILESKKFYNLYKKICESCKYKNVIIATHFPFQDWSEEATYQENFTYIHGHTHKNEKQYVGTSLILGDNQIGYHNEKVEFKKFLISCSFDYFADRDDGIFEISKEEYKLFLSGIKHYGEMNYSYCSKIYALKNNHLYMFIGENKNGTLYHLVGGRLKKLTVPLLNYYYNLMNEYFNFYNNALKKYNKYLVTVSDFIRSIGGSGSIHGAIVDIDFYNHVFVNPFDGKVTPYFATAMDDKLIYSNLEALLSDQNLTVYKKLKEFQNSNSGNELYELFYNSNNAVEKPTFDKSTDIYKISNFLYSLQKSKYFKIIRTWNDNIINILEDNSKAPQGLYQLVEEDDED